MTRRLLASALACAGAFAALTACGGPAGPEPSTVSVNIRLGDGAQLAPAFTTPMVVGPQGVPFDPGSGTVGVTVLMLTVVSEGEPLQFDANGDVVQSGGSNEVPLAGNSVTVRLPHGVYDFKVTARDDAANDLADGSKLAQTIFADTTIKLDLLSFVGTAELIGPQVVVPNQVVDVSLLVHPPNRPDLVVPTGDFTVSYTGNASQMQPSQRGVRLTVVCEPITVGAQVIDKRGGEAINASLELPIAAMCDSYPTNPGTDVIPPWVTIDQPPGQVTVGLEYLLSGEVNDDQSSVDSVELFDGPVSLGYAALDLLSYPPTWTFLGFTPSQTRDYVLTALARDSAGNEARTSVTLTAIAADDGNLRFTSISAGGQHACGVTSAGKAYCWGSNSTGQLGDGTALDRSVPVGVAGSIEFETISAGDSHTCGVSTGGEAYCWGSNSYRQLGDGTNDASVYTPQVVSGGLTFDTIFAGYLATCGVTTTGTGYCWGSGSYGKLGNGSGGGSNIPVEVAGNHVFQSIATGFYDACAVTVDGAAYCWGDNSWGQLGDGSLDSSNVPVAVIGGHSFAGVSMGWNFTCGLTTEASVYCWGSNTSGQLGTGTVDAGGSTPQLVVGDSEMQQQSTGYYHSCAVDGDGAAHCWGSNASGGLGNGTTGNSSSPVVVAGNHVFSTVTASFSGSFTCALAVDGTPYCWGDNGWGQLGDGTNISKSVPIMVGGP